MNGVYDVAEAYALAFSYRDIPAEVDALIGWATEAAGPVESVIELAAGPADHAIEMARRGMRAAALDLSPAMSDYARHAAALTGVPLQVITADMREFMVEERFDLAITMIDSLAHLLSPSDVDAHFRSVARHMSDGGIYLVEFSHPNDSVGDTALTETAWSQRAGESEVSFQWGEPGDQTNPVTGVTSVNVSVDYRPAGRPAVRIHELVQQRQWQQADILASLERSGSFDALAWYGSFEGIPLDDPKAWRMIALLRRTPAS